MTFSDEITTLALDLARSLWAELGVGAGPARHDWQALDLEPLIIFTASLIGTDDTLIARTLNWCAVNGSYISALRMRYLARHFGVPAEAVDKFARAATERRANNASAEAPDLKRPALLQLRLRALMGIGPRTEALRLLLADPETPSSAKSLAQEAGYGMPSMGLALHALTAAGIVRGDPVGVSTLYSLARPGELAVAVNGVPVAFPNWMSVFAVIGAIRGYAAQAEQEPAQRVASAKKLVSTLRSEFSNLAASAQLPAIRGEASVKAFEDWARSFVGEQAGATQRADASEASYSVHRLALGGWIATVTIAGGQPRPLALSEVPLLRPERRSHRRTKDDPVAEAAAVVEMMLQDMLTRAMQRRLGSTVGLKAAAEPHLVGLSREFATELLLPMHTGQASAFSEKFLQHWLATHRYWHDISA